MESLVFGYNLFWYARRTIFSTQDSKYLLKYVNMFTADCEKLLIHI